MPTGLKGFDQAQLVLGADTGEHVDGVDAVDELLVGDGLEFRAGQHIRPIRFAVQDSDLGRNGRGGGGVVAGDHLDLDSGALAGGHSRRRLFARRVHHALQAEEDKPGRDVGVLKDVRCGRHVLAREGEDAEPAGRHLLGRGTECIRVDGRGAGGSELAVTTREQALERTLHVHQPGAPRTVLVQGGHELELRLEGYGIDTGEGGRCLVLRKSGLRGHRQESPFRGVAAHCP